MSHESGEFQEDVPREEAEYLNANEVQEEVPNDFDEDNYSDDGDEVNAQDMDVVDDGDDEALEIDLSNNSWTYFDQHKDSIFVIASHPTLPMVVTGGGDNTAFMWTTHSQPPRFVCELQGHKESVISATFTHDGKYVITGDMNGLIQVHKSKSGGQKWVKFADLEEVEEVLFITVHPLLPYFAFGAQDGSIWVYQIDESSGTLVQIMSGFLHTLECNSAAFIKPEKVDELNLVSISEDGTVVYWNCFSNTIQFKLSPHDEFKGLESPWVSLSSYKNLTAVGARDGQLAIINNDTGKVVHSVKTIENTDDVADLSIEALDWCHTPLVNLLAVGLVSGDILLFDTLQWRLRRSIKLDDTITRLQFIGDTPALVASSMNGKVYKWDARTAQELFVGVGHNMGVLDFAVLEEGKKIITAGDEGVSLVFVHA
ncbi:uncharacterized protein PRCAT00005600001 [Priceomyces carsonii]|uniref:uncharacterized protein n=1 Tax=Priceomyces carsonii TaxID=28549 RepID=UPI002EDB19E9|nr:unnamed protein product [Priceomyces carsonii]